MSRTWIYRSIAAVAALVLSATLLTAVSTPANAYTCSGGKSTTLNSDSGVASADVTFYPSCSDGKAHWNGVLRDTKCDGRAARFVISTPYTPFGQAWSRDHNNPNGCHTGSSFSGSDTRLGSNWHVEIAVGACNSLTCASWTIGSLAYNSN
ncbi:hypothetical protein N5079_28330 [Planotetraspora sp. A-T 1434]|uniref:hypothetical protein n=1 Tax=Planotetraspora sp. A-T 1434 TaxID=2979219 RepID=UPI0021C0FBC1|nr:hypothetical protein [Planotetraspora sp. A-T 1434]MCT9934124.1 hypothetical protein [Planotetraspora sp. A-T 1434]